MQRTNSLRRSMPARIPITNETINYLKADTIQNNKKIKILKTKIEKINEKALVRDNAIKNVFTQTKKDQKISTASASANENLRVTIKTLQNTKEFRQQHLNELLTSDRYWKAGELESEIVTLYSESVRTEQDCQNLHNKHDILDYRISQLKQALKISVAKNNEIPDIETDISELKHKNQAYMRGNRKASATDILARSSDDINVCNEMITKVKQQVSDLEKELETVTEEHQKIADESKESIEALDQLIDEALQKIEAGLKQRNQDNESEKTEVDAQEADKNDDENSNNNDDENHPEEENKHEKSQEEQDNVHDENSN